MVGVASERRRASDRERIGTTRERGYGKGHVALRKRWAIRIAQGNVKCARCHELIAPGAQFHLGHNDFDRTQYSGPEHPGCNTATAGRWPKKRTAPQAPVLPQSRAW